MGLASRSQLRSAPALASFFIGVSYGLVAGYYGGKLDEWMMRFVDILNAVPTLLFVILIMVYFRAGNPEEFTGFKAIFYEWDSQLGGLLSIFIGIGLTSWGTAGSDCPGRDPLTATS